MTTATPSPGTAPGLPGIDQLTEDLWSCLSALDYLHTEIALIGADDPLPAPLRDLICVLLVATQRAGMPVVQEFSRVLKTLKVNEAPHDY